jgi:hypothetical protein
VRIKMHSKALALETLAKHLSMFKENIGLDVNVSLSDLVAGSYKLERDELQLPPPTPAIERNAGDRAVRR